jgi:membrane protein DedA with SNARE-associated domain/membrane-associated phospholipid phosphatase
MFASISDRILSLPAWVALLVVFLVPALEASAFVGFVFPGEIAVLLGGVLASQGRFPLWAAIVAAVAGAAIGDSIGYLIGRRWGHALLHGTLGRLPIIRRALAKHLDTATAYVRRRGPHAVLVGRFTAALRVLVPGLAGMAELPYGTFLLFNAIGAVLWGAGFVLLGYAAGAAWHRVAADASRVGLALLALVLLGLIATRALRTVREHGTTVADLLAALPPANWFRERYPRQSAWLARRIDSANARGFSLSLSVVGGSLGLWVFGALTQDVVANEESVLHDPSITSWIASHRVAWLTELMRSVTGVGSSFVLIPIVILIGAVCFVRWGTVRPMIQLAFALTSSIAAYEVAKALVDRPRPPMVDWLVRAAGSSFPSGHSVNAAAVFGTIALIASERRGTRARIAIGSAALLVGVVVGASRVYLGVHWFTDVVAGLALGWCIVAIVSAGTILLTSHASSNGPARVGVATAGPRRSQDW